MCTRVEGSLRKLLNIVETCGTLSLSIDSQSSHVVREEKSNNAQDKNNDHVHHLEFLVFLLVSNSVCVFTDF